MPARAATRATAGRCDRRVHYRPSARPHGPPAVAQAGRRPGPPAVVDVLHGNAGRGLPGRGCSGRAGLAGVLEGVEALAPAAELQVEVGARDEAGGAAEADDLAGGDALAGGNLKGAEVAVEGGVAAVVLEEDHQA